MDKLVRLSIKINSLLSIFHWLFSIYSLDKRINILTICIYISLFTLYFCIYSFRAILKSAFVREVEGKKRNLITLYISIY